LTTLLAADDLTRSFRRVHALNGASLAVSPGETLAVVGESGCGKSTLARALVRLLSLDSGQIVFDGQQVGDLSGDALRRYHRRVQMVFQDPYGSLNPRMTVGETIAEALAVHRLAPPDRRATRVAELLAQVGLPASAAARMPHAFSGGQRQRIALARALAVEPELLIADEIVSALDVSVQAQILNLLLDLQERLGLAMIFVSHDLRVVRHVAHRVAVMYLGRIVETGPVDAVFDRPRHPYTEALLRAVPQIDPTQRRAVAPVLLGELPSPLDLPAGCAFHPRCPHVMPRCRTDAPALSVPMPAHTVRCHLQDGAGQDYERTLPLALSR
jgi:oligopeptide/dipeptide ABC transporter ATP-binding protein